MVQLATAGDLVLNSGEYISLAPTQDIDVPTPNGAFYGYYDVDLGQYVTAQAVADVTLINNKNLSHIIVKATDFDPADVTALTNNPMLFDKLVANGTSIPELVLTKADILHGYLCNCTDNYGPHLYDVNDE